MDTAEDVSKTLVGMLRKERDDWTKVSGGRCSFLA